jgi:hypothetical protein
MMLLNKNAASSFASLGCAVISLLSLRAAQSRKRVHSVALRPSFVVMCLRRHSG